MATEGCLDEKEEGIQSATVEGCYCKRSFQFGGDMLDIGQHRRIARTSATTMTPTMAKALDIVYDEDKTAEGCVRRLRRWIRHGRCSFLDESTSESRDVDAI